MIRPRDENLRLIRMDEEAGHIAERYRGARNTALFFLAAVIAAAAVLLLAAPEPSLAALFVQAGVPGLLAIAFPALLFLLAFYTLRSLRYVWYRRRHRAFLRKHNRI